jgi:hypothetical protein
MIARASDIVAMSFRAFAIRKFIIAPLLFADLILLSVRIDRLIHPVKTVSMNGFYPDSADAFIKAGQLPALRLGRLRRRKLPGGGR